VAEDVTNSCLVSETDAGTAGIAVLQAETTAQLPSDVRAVAEEQINDSKFEREHPLIGQLGSALNLTSKDLDDIFREADALV